MCKNITKKIFISIILFNFAALYGQNRATRPNTAIILPGTSVKARLIYVAAAPIEGSPTGPRIFVAKIEGYAITPSGNKIDMDKNYIVGWGMGDAVTSRIAINFTKLSYYYNGEPIETPITAWAYHNGLAGIPATVVVSKEFEYISKVFTIEFLNAFAEVLSKSIIPDLIATSMGGEKVSSSGSGTASIANTNAVAYAIGGGAQGGLKGIIDYYNAQLNLSFPQLMTTNNMVIEVVFTESFQYSSKDWVDIENSAKGIKKITE